MKLLVKFTEDAQNHDKSWFQAIEFYLTNNDQDQCAFLRRALLRAIDDAVVSEHFSMINIHVLWDIGEDQPATQDLRCSSLFAIPRLLSHDQMYRNLAIALRFIRERCCSDYLRVEYSRVEEGAGASG
ncbi:hypothetical protein SBOR_7443 [Sclerotinia borealis F-4128]|uniref:Uncharacterized protein n=1 Tax=Sclerotinia borealis (strain F-4128) TaxID=1432307 RepID=W9C8J9_SCLBF|nr:hypothetical protein SBOR_7443 [Sclerotinia borealis F-4128]